MEKIAIAILIALAIWLIKLFLSDGFRFHGMRIGDLTVENPYGKDYERDFPRKVRFLRLPIKARIGKLYDVSVEMSISNEPVGSIDSPGLLHWQRQPGSGKAHTLSLHQALKDEHDVRKHMYEFHFAENAPVDIHHGDEDKVDLLMKIEGLDYAITTVSRENHVPPGAYTIEVKVSSKSISRPKKKVFKVEVGPGVEDFLPTA